MDKKQIVLWGKKAQTWNSLKGTQQICPQDEGIFAFSRIPDNYPEYKNGPHHHEFIIDAACLPSQHIRVAYFLVDGGKIEELQDIIGEIAQSWANTPETVVKRPELLSQVDPWLSIELFYLNAAPDK